MCRLIQVPLLRLINIIHAVYSSISFQSFCHCIIYYTYTLGEVTDLRRERLPGDRFIWRALRPILRRPFMKRYNLHAVNAEKLPDPPFLLVGNHAYFIDAALIEAFVKYPIVWAVAAGNFKLPLAASILKAAGAIEKRKGVPDVAAMRKILRVLKDGGIIGLMPEGSVTWDGEFGEVPPGTEKFLDRVDVPVVAARMNGGYLTRPRWADHHRWGRIEIVFEVLRGSEALDFLSRSSDWEWQREKRILFKGRKRASGIERIVWFCEKCGGFRTIAARGDEAVCAECGAALIVDEYGYISGKSVPEVLKVQRELLAAYLSREGSLKVGPGEAVILNTLTEVIVKVRGEVSIDGLELKVGERSYRLENARGFSTYLKRLNEFNYDRDVIRLKTEHSSYLLYCAYRILAGPEAATL